MNIRRLKGYNVVLAALLLGITLFSLFKYLAATKEKDALLDDLGVVKGQVLELEQNLKKEKELQETLAQENSALKDELSAGAGKLAELEAQLDRSQKIVEQITEQIVLAKTENIALREQKDQLALELDQTARERDELKVRLSSIPELKKSIREVKVRMHKAKSMMKEITVQRQVIEGNRGYLMKNGVSTFPGTGTRVKIEVMPASQSK